MTFYLDNENQPEVTIQLYRYDGSDCLAVVDGNSTALVKRANVVDMMGGSKKYCIELNEN